MTENAPMTSLRTNLAAIRKGKEDVQAGRIVSHEKTARWLHSWGKKHELPPPSSE
jgi:predicted transcriptional regulator